MIAKLKLSLLLQKNDAGSNSLCCLLAYFSLKLLEMVVFI